MKTKIFLLGIFYIFTFTTYGQRDKSMEIEINTITKELKVTTENLEDLKNFDWNIITEMFQENDENEEIALAFSFENKSELNKAKVRIDNFKMKITGKGSNLEKLTSRLKKSFEKLDKIDGQYITD
ncbi:hypothetical protein [Mariniflexile sp.]|uniref:hypothetical protein n=1 Tax=Mariniflexile sp. TaxID=1979402 RepID=UPI0035631215